MSYTEALNNFSKQCSYKPAIINAERLKPFKKIIILGMGGSRLAPDVLNMLRPELEVFIHSGFDLPALSVGALSEAIVIANSYSGNTAEVLSGAEAAVKAGLNLVTVSTGGLLSQLAQQNNLPHIIMPNDGIAPRLAIGYNLAALMEMLGLGREALESCNLADSSEQGRMIATSLAGSVPLVYSPERYIELGYIWKIGLNETAKLPAFCNRFPELDHNELAGFDESSKALFTGMKCVCLRDSSDDERINKRIDAVAKILNSKGVVTQTVELVGASPLEKMLNSILLAHWTAFHIAEQRGVDPMAIPVIEQFKEAMK